jgi:hypothetical protein
MKRREPPLSRAAEALFDIIRIIKPDQRTELLRQQQ